MKKPETFWLARDNIDVQSNYNISKTKMNLVKCDNWAHCYMGKGSNTIDRKMANLLGLPRLRKGQQVQIKRTNHGFEIVKGMK